MLHWHQSQAYCKKHVRPMKHFYVYNNLTHPIALKNPKNGRTNFSISPSHTRPLSSTHLQNLWYRLVKRELVTNRQIAIVVEHSIEKVSTSGLNQIVGKNNVRIWVNFIIMRLQDKQWCIVQSDKLQCHVLYHTCRTSQVVKLATSPVLHVQACMSSIHWDKDFNFIYFNCSNKMAANFEANKHANMHRWRFS